MPREENRKKGSRRAAKERMVARRQLHYRYREKAFEVLFHRCLYYCLDRPEISDAEYDDLERKLAAFEKRKRVCHEDSPTQTVGSSEWTDYPVMVRARVRQHLRELGEVE